MVIKDPNEIKSQCTIKFLFIKIRVNKLRIKKSFPQQEIPYLGNSPFKTRTGNYQLDRLDLLTRQERMLALDTRPALLLTPLDPCDRWPRLTSSVDLQLELSHRSNHQSSHG